ncbi:hypothetical protein [Rhodoflexus sp.]
MCTQILQLITNSEIVSLERLLCLSWRTGSDSEGRYRLQQMYAGDSIATSAIFPQLSFQAAQIFED